MLYEIKIDAEKWDEASDTWDIAGPAIIQIRARSSAQATTKALREADIRWPGYADAECGSIGAVILGTILPGGKSDI